MKNLLLTITLMLTTLTAVAQLNISVKTNKLIYKDLPVEKLGMDLNDEYDDWTNQKNTFHISLTDSLLVHDHRGYGYESSVTQIYKIVKYAIMNEDTFVAVEFTVQSSISGSYYQYFYVYSKITGKINTLGILDVDEDSSDGYLTGTYYYVTGLKGLRPLNIN